MKVQAYHPWFKLIAKGSLQLILMTAH